jgi:hypothetical protein
MDSTLSALVFSVLEIRSGLAARFISNWSKRRGESDGDGIWSNRKSSGGVLFLALATWAAAGTE